MAKIEILKSMKEMKMITVILKKLLIQHMVMNLIIMIN
jgi:hypothetical protein